MGDTKSIRSFKSTRSSRSSTGRRKSLSNSEVERPFVEKVIENFDLIFLSVVPSKGKEYNFFSSEYLNKYHKAFDIQVDDDDDAVAKVILKIKSIVDKFHGKEKGLMNNGNKKNLLILNGSFDSFVLKTLILAKYPIKIVLKVYCDFDNRESDIEFDDLKTSELTENMIFFECQVPIDPTELCEEEYRAYNAFVCCILKELLNMFTYHENYLKNLEIIEIPIYDTQDPKDLEVEEIFNDLLNSINTLNLEEELEEKDLSLPGELSINNFSQFYEGDLKSWIEGEIPHVMYLIEKADCKSPNTSRTTSIVSFLLHEILQDPIKDLFQDFQLKTHPPSMAYQVKPGVSLKFSTKINEIPFDFGDLKIINEQGYHSNIQISFQTQDFTLKIMTDLPQNKRIRNILMYNQKSRINFEKPRRRLRLSSSSKKSIKISDSRSIKSAISKKSRSILKSSSSILTQREEKYNFYAENSHEAVVSLVDGVLTQTKDQQKMLYFKNSLVEIGSLEVKIYLFNGTIFDIKIEESSQENDEIDENSTKKYQFELNFLQDLLDSFAFQNHVSRELKRALDKNLAKIIFTSSDGFHFQLKDDKLMFIQRFYCWDYFDYQTGSQVVDRDDGFQSYCNENSFIAKFSNNFLFVTELKEVFTLGNVELFCEDDDDDEAIPSFLDQIIEISTTKFEDQPILVTKKVKITSDLLSAIIFIDSEKPNCEGVKMVVEMEKFTIKCDETNKYFEVENSENRMILDLVKGYFDLSKDQSKILVHFHDANKFLEGFSPTLGHFSFSWDLKSDHNDFSNCEQTDHRDYWTKHEEFKEIFEGFQMKIRKILSFPEHNNDRGASKTLNYPKKENLTANALEIVKERNERLRTYLVSISFNDYKSINYWKFLNYNSHISNFPIEELKQAIKSADEPLDECSNIQ